MPDVHEGGCLCGAIRYRVMGNPQRASVCHCTDCQRVLVARLPLSSGSKRRMSS